MLYPILNQKGLITEVSAQYLTDKTIPNSCWALVGPSTEAVQSREDLTRFNQNPDIQYTMTSCLTEYAYDDFFKILLDLLQNRQVELDNSKRKGHKSTRRAIVIFNQT